MRGWKDESRARYFVSKNRGQGAPSTAMKAGLVGLCSGVRQVRCRAWTGVDLLGGSGKRG